MSLVVPSFLAHIEDRSVIVTAEKHALRPAVLFETLTELVLRTYNINNPKEENMYLVDMEGRPNARRVSTEMPVDLAHIAMTGLLQDYQQAAIGLLNVGESQLKALFDHASDRVDLHETIEDQAF